MQYYSVSKATKKIIQGPLSAPWEVNPATEALVSTNDDGSNLSDATYYAAFRQRAYLPVGDQLDAHVKGGVDWDNMKAACLAVNATNPRPASGG